MKDILLRGVPSRLASALDADADARGQSRQRRLLEILEERYGEAPKPVGWIQIDRRVGAASCRICGEEIATDAWCGVHNGALYAPVCAVCVENSQRGAA